MCRVGDPEGRRPGGAHSDPEALFRNLDAILERQLEELLALSTDALVEGRYQKFRNMGRLGQEFLDQAPKGQTEGVP